MLDYWDALFLSGATCLFLSSFPIRFKSFFLQIFFRFACHIEAETNGWHFADGIFKWIFLNESVWIPIKISLKFVPKGPVNNVPVLVQIMAWRRSGYKPLSEAMMVNFPTHVCVSRPQWVNTSWSFFTIVSAVVKWTWKIWVKLFCIPDLIKQNKVCNDWFVP